MGFTIRLGGWRPVQLEEGEGVLRSEDGSVHTSVAYRFEVWHQMVAGFPGPFRSEGRITVPDGVAGEPFMGLERGDLELEDGRRLALRLAGDGSFVAHERPDSPASK